MKAFRAKMVMGFAVVAAASQGTARAEFANDEDLPRRAHRLRQSRGRRALRERIWKQNELN